MYLALISAASSEMLMLSFKVEDGLMCRMFLSLNHQSYKAFLVTFTVTGLSCGLQGFLNWLVQ